MGLRLVEVILPEREAETLRSTVEFDPRGGPWCHALLDGLVATRYLVEMEDSSEMVDEIQRTYGSARGFHLLLSPVNAALPRPPEAEEKRKEKTRTYGTRDGGLTREELLTEGLEMARPGRTFYATVVLSTIVVAIGLMRDNPAVIIGAMVIAPLLGPNVALALATTLSEPKLMRLGLQSNAIGFVVALAITTLLGLLLSAVPMTGEIEMRTGVHWSDLVLALAAGSAGALALTTGVPTALVGVMVAVALLPPTAVVGLMLGSGHPGEAGRAALLLLTNVICVNLAATITFRTQGIQPRTWWQAEKARKASLRAMLVGGALVIALAVLIYLTQV
jgi:uncharacterized hydrophobic protein (TIGR00341 family)